MTEINKNIIQDLLDEKIFKLTILDLYKLLKDKALHTDQSTQRAFIYKELECQLSIGKVSKAEGVIYAILKENIQLPALTFWWNTETKQLNVMDGKQRLLSIKAFIEGEISAPVAEGGRSVMFDGLSEEDQQRLAAYKFVIDVKKGTSKEEETNFDAINANGEALKTYELLRGKSYGRFLDGFEDYINQQSTLLEGVKKIGRGDQAIQILYGYANIKDSRKPTYSSDSYKKLSEIIAVLRNTEFDPSINNFKEKLELFSVLKSLSNCELNDYTAMSIACFVVRNDLDADTVKVLYRKAVSNANDIRSWDLDTHKTFIMAKFNDNLELYPIRFFTEADKNTLYTQDHQCAYVDPVTKVRCSETRYSELAVDHKKPWSKGGSTTLDNAQLMCKKHNSSKNNNYKE